MQSTRKRSEIGLSLSNSAFMAEGAQEQRVALLFYERIDHTSQRNANIAVPTCCLLGSLNRKEGIRTNNGHSLPKKWHFERRSLSPGHSHSAADGQRHCRQLQLQRLSQGSSRIDFRPNLSECRMCHCGQCLYRRKLNDSGRR